VRAWICVCVRVDVCVCVNIHKQNQTFSSFIKGFNTQLSYITFCQIAFSHSNTSPGLVSRFSETATQKKNLVILLDFQHQCKKGTSAEVRKIGCEW
jgi:hypothetical protein